MGDRERQILEAAKAGDLLAISQLVEGNLRGVVDIAIGYRNKGLPLPDLIQEGNVGLIEAVEGYDLASDVSFLHYAGFHIRRAILHALHQQVDIVRLPDHKARLRLKWIKISKQLEMKLGRPPYPQEVQAEMNISTKQLQILVKHFAHFGKAVGDVALSAESDVVDSDLNDPLEGVIQHDQILRLDAAIDLLEPDEHLVIMMRYLMDPPATYPQIAHELGCTKSGAQFICKRALEHLRVALEPSDKSIAG